MRLGRWIEMGTRARGIRRAAIAVLVNVKAMLGAWRQPIHGCDHLYSGQDSPAKLNKDDGARDSGTGRAGLEAALASLIEPRDRVVVVEHGRFGLLMIEIAERCGAEVVAVRGEWGRPIEPEAVEAALKAGRTKLVAIVHGETSTGILQPLAEIARLAHEHDALLVADCVVTLGGCEVAVDLWGVDVAIAG